MSKAVTGLISYHVSRSAEIARRVPKRRQEHRIWN